MRPLHRMSSVLAACFVGWLFVGNSAFAQLLSCEQIVQALIAQPAAPEPRRPTAAHAFTDI
jgi:hypothetical protein